MLQYYSLGTRKPEQNYIYRSGKTKTVQLTRRGHNHLILHIATVDGSELIKGRTYHYVLRILLV